MKVCLVNPPIEDFYSTGIRRQPLGLLYIARALKNAGHEVSLINCNTPKKHLLPLPREFSYLEKYMRSGTKYKFPFKNYYRFGMSTDEIKRSVKETDADIFMVSSLFTTYYQEADEIISIIKELKKDVMITAGGYHAALYPGYFLNECGVDYVITGEGEESSAALLNYLSGNTGIEDIPNLAYMDKGSIRFTDMRLSDIDKIEAPDRRFLGKRDIKAYRKIMISMITSRGCPNSCRFCTGKAIWGSTYRVRATENIINEIELCAREKDADIINFEDDNLFHSKRRAAELLNGIIDIKKKFKKPIEFTAMNGISIENLDEEILLLMKRAGFNEINISLVTHSKSLQQKLERPFDSEKFRLVAVKAKELGMNVRAYFILGLPEQTQEEIEDTVGFLKGLEVKIFPSVFYNVNSPHEEWKTQRSSAFFNESAHITRDELIEIFNKCLQKNRGLS